MRHDEAGAAPLTTLATDDASASGQPLAAGLLLAHAWLRPLATCITMTMAGEDDMQRYRIEDAAPSYIPAGTQRQARQAGSIRFHQVPSGSIWHSRHIAQRRNRVATPRRACGADGEREGRGSGGLRVCGWTEARAVSRPGSTVHGPRSAAHSRPNARGKRSEIYAEAASTGAGSEKGPHECLAEDRTIKAHAGACTGTRADASETEQTEERRRRQRRQKRL